MALKKHSRRTGSGFASCASPVQPMTESWDMKHLDDNDVKQAEELPAEWMSFGTKPSVNLSGNVLKSEGLPARPRRTESDNV